MNELQKFSNDKFGTIRTVIKDDEPWFVATDVCKSLDIGNNRRATERLDKDEKADVTLSDGSQMRHMTAVNEPGLYSLILGSRKPEAKEFKRWVTHEILPTIRKTGGYVKNTEQFLDFYVPDADEVTRAKFGAMVELSHQLNRQIRELKDDKEKNAPKVEFADAVSASDTSIMVGDMAKMLKQNGIKIGRQRLFKWLRENHYLMKGGEEYNMPTQRSMNQEWFEIKETIQYDKRNNPIICRTPKITGKGQRHLVRKFLELKERGEI